MKRILFLAVLAVIAVFVTGSITLSEAGAMRFLMNMSTLTDQGKGEEVCDQLHDDLEFHLIDHTSPSTKELKGGKQELCSLIKASVAALSAVPHDRHSNFTKVNVTREWLHPWTSQVSYTEDQDITIRGANVTLKTTSDDKVTLVQTFTGVKLLKIDAEMWVAE